MASYEIDQRGGHYDDLRAGAIASVIANVNRDREARPEPFAYLDFMPWSEHSKAAELSDPKPVLLEDPEAQSALLLQMVFAPKRG